MGRPTNPYQAGAPVREEKGFFGRQDTLKWVERELYNPTTNFLVLFGQRRIGKTTLLHQLKRILPERAFLSVYFDLHYYTDSPLGQVLADLADTFTTKVGLERPDQDAFDDRGDFFLHTFLPPLYAILGENCRPVFLLDEFDVLYQPNREMAATATLFPFLDRIMTHDRRPAFVVAIGRRAEDFSPEFIGQFKGSLEREIWVLDRESAEALVRQAEANNTLRFANRSVDRILKLTNCHPFLTQLLCQRIWERAYDGSPAAPPMIDVPEVEAAIPDALKVGGMALTWLWNGLSSIEKIFAAALAEIAREGDTIAENRVIQVLADHAPRLRWPKVEKIAPHELVRRRVLEWVREREYCFTVELFRCWVRQNKPLRKVKDELDRIEPVADRIYEAGEEYFNMRNWGSAVRSFQFVLEEKVDHFRARHFLGQAQLKLGKFDEAVAELEQAYVIDPSEARDTLARALIAQARAREEAGDEKGALAAVERVRQVSPDEPMAQEISVRIWMQRGDRALERDDLSTALAAYRRAGHAEKASQVERLLRQALVKLEREARAHEQAQRWTDAANSYKRLVDQALEEESKARWKTAQLFSEGIRALRQQDWQRAEEALAEVMDRHPNYEKGGQSAENLLEQARQRLRILEAHTSEIRSIAFLFNGEILVTGSWDRTVRLWQVENMTLLRTLKGHGGPVNSLTLSPEGEILASGSGDRTVRLWAMADGKLLRSLEGHIGPVNSVTFSPDGMFLASGSGDRTVRLWHAADGELLGILEGHGDPVNSVAFSPDGTNLASGARNREILLWRVADRALQHTLTQHTDWVSSLAFDPSGFVLASGAWDGTICLWRVGGYELWKTLTGRVGRVKSVAFSPDSRILASVAGDETVQLWRVDNGTLFRELKVRGGRLNSMAFSPDGAMVVSGSQNGAICMWHLAED